MTILILGIVLAGLGLLVIPSLRLVFYWNGIKNQVAAYVFGLGIALVTFFVMNGARHDILSWMDYTTGDHRGLLLGLFLWVPVVAFGWLATHLLHSVIDRQRRREREQLGS